MDPTGHGAGAAQLHNQHASRSAYRNSHLGTMRVLVQQYILSRRHAVRPRKEGARNKGKDTSGKLLGENVKRVEKRGTWRHTHTQTTFNQCVCHRHACHYGHFTDNMSMLSALADRKKRRPTWQAFFVWDAHSQMLCTCQPSQPTNKVCL